MATVEKPERLRERTDGVLEKHEVIPKLVAGDHLTRDEFERRYMAMPNVKKAELIEGRVYTPSPVSVQNHGSPHADVVGWLAYYRAHTHGVQVADNSTVRLDATNEPQPDALLRVLPEFGGQTTNDGDYVGGGPELTVEISASTKSYDRHEKLTAYERNKVCEYLIWRVHDDAFDWFVLRDGRYEKLPPDAEGHLKSEIFPGLWLDPQAMLAEDMAKVFAVLQQGLATPEHAQFVEKLRAAATKSGS